jgi:lipid-binding SYLF domain-containing protein
MVPHEVGAESTDLALFFMNDCGARSLVNGSRITLGAGISLEGARLAPSPADNANHYGRGVTHKQLLFGPGGPTMPAEADEFSKAIP